MVQIMSLFRITNAGSFLLGVLLITFNCNTVMCQEIVLHGSVMDNQTFESLQGVHVLTNNNRGVTTDIEGNFHIKVDMFDTLHFSMLGYDALWIVVTDQSEDQSVLVSMKLGTRILDEIAIQDYHQANTMIKLPVHSTYPVPGIHYGKVNEADKYRLGVGGAIFSPMTSIYRLTSKTYKQEKRVYEERLIRDAEDAYYNSAKKVLYEALEALDTNLDEYYMVDFIHFLGMNLKSVSGRTVYEMIQILPGQVDRFYAQLED